MEFYRTGEFTMDDRVAKRTGWNDWKDSMVKSGKLPPAARNWEGYPSWYADTPGKYRKTK